MKDAIPERIDQFRIIREIGSGGMGVIYEAEETPIGRHVALKVLHSSIAADPRIRERFLREIRTTAKLVHPNIIQVHHVGETNGCPYYTMEYVGGVSLSFLLKHPNVATQYSGKNQGPDTVVYPGNRADATVVLPEAQAEPTVVADGRGHAADAARRRHDSDGGEGPPQGKEYYSAVARLIRDAALGLEYAHEHGVIHRDVKPSNILLALDGQVRVTDFGIAFESGAEELTRVGTLVGTPKYMSPEQLVRRDVNVDRRTDVYSLGVTLYELLTLSSAYSARSDRQLLLQILVQDPRRPRQINPAIPRDLETVVQKAMEKNPDHRYASARELAEDLDRFLKREPVLAVPATALERGLKMVRRHRVLSAILAAALVFGPIGAGSAWRIQRLRRKAEVRELADHASHLLDTDDVHGAVRLLEAAHKLDNRDTLIAAQLAQAEAQVRKWEQDKERERRAAAALELAAAAKQHLTTYLTASQRRRELKPKIQQAFRDLNGIRPCAESPNVKELESLLLGMEEALWQAEQDIPVAYAGAQTLLMKALSFAPNVELIKKQLAHFYHAALLEAERDGDIRQAKVLHELAGVYADSRLRETLERNGIMSIETSPSGATVALYRYVREINRLGLHLEGTLGETPLRDKKLPAGSYMLLIRKPGFRTVRCPVYIQRSDKVSLQVPLYTDAQIGPGMVYVPPGPFIQGQDPGAEWPLPDARPSLSGFFIGEKEISWGEYLEFVNDLARKDPSQARTRLPRLDPWGKDIAWPEDGKTEFSVPRSASPNFPVSGISVRDAEAYCVWRSERDGLTCRLPTAAEWEKAARGVDGRFFPWGNSPDPRCANMWYWARRAKTRRAGPARGGTYVNDCSPFDVHDMAGNVCEMCADDFDQFGDRTVRGAAWYQDYPKGRIATRRRFFPTSVNRGVGFRIACDPPRNP